MGAQAAATPAWYHQDTAAKAGAEGQRCNNTARNRGGSAWIGETLADPCSATDDAVRIEPARSMSPLPCDTTTAGVVTDSLSPNNRCP
ncbi:hypothetical protein MLAC_14730 [Mycobacterium lacus]|uniref:Uncharacterized protein n=1 Tax=Mycobacterium lacus TaxID=169765 RepID=A0A7I7NIS2_9MYCO|nr:hypothetical protein MLAC_14730 [Mycobacterium lacus]